MSGYHVGIDLGGTRIKAIALSAEGEALYTKKVPTEGVDAVQWVAALVGLLREMQERLGAEAASIGLCAPGLAAKSGTHIAYMPGRMQQLEGLHWTDELATPVPVRVLNDAQAALLGECWRGAALGARNVVLFTLGTGVGGAILCDGRLLHGAIGRAGHLGHISLDPLGTPGITGCPGALEDAIGNHSLAERTNGRYSDTFALLRGIAAGDLDAASHWAIAVAALGAAVVSVINVADPERVILGGGIADAGEALFAPLQAYLDKHEWRPGGHRVSLVRAALGDTAGALGAAHFAMTYGEES